MKKHRMMMTVYGLCAALILEGCALTGGGKADTMRGKAGDSAARSDTASGGAAERTHTPISSVTPTPRPSVAAPQQAGVNDRDPEKLSEAFVRNSFSYHSALAVSDAIDSEAQNFAAMLKWRRALITKRRKAFGNAQSITQMTVEKSYKSIAGDRAFLFLNTLETLAYADEPALPATVRATYALLLRRVGGVWRIAWANGAGGLGQLAGGAGETKDERQARNCYDAHGILLPFVPADALPDGVQSLDLQAYAGQDVFSLCERFPYADFKALTEKETNEIDAEKAELTANLPRANDGTLPAGLKAFDRQAMKAYMEEWALKRNQNWSDFSSYGGDCQNFASQVILSGGAPMATGDGGWYFKSMESRTPAWSGVPWMTEFLTQNEGVGPHGKKAESWTQLETGDMIHTDWDYSGEGDHATVISMEGKQPRFCGHSGDAKNQRVSDTLGHKIFLHLTGYLS